jgi:hypothetical protein
VEGRTLSKISQKGKVRMPDSKIPIAHPQVREALWGAEWEVVRLTIEDFLPDLPFKEGVGLIVIYNAIFKADLAGKPTNQAQLAKEMGLSRPAIRQRLELFEARGVIEPGWQRGANPIRINRAMLASPKSDERLRRILQLYIDAVVTVSKVEGDFGRTASDGLLRSFSTDALEQEIARRIVIK